MPASAGTIREPLSGPPAATPPASPRFRERWAAYGELLGSYIATLAKDRPVRLLCEMPGNIGDHLIWSGTDDVFAASGATFSRLRMAEVASTSPCEDCLVIPGNAACTLFWNEWLPALVADAADRFAQVVILPSQYDPAVPVVAAALARPNVFAFARDPTSYARIRRFGRAALAFDPALYSRLLPGPDAAPPASTGESRRLVALREDPESMLSAHGCRPDPRVNRDISRVTANLAEFLACIDAADEVVTDRMHVAVAAVMTGRRIRYFDPHNRKISNYFDFVFRDELAGLAEPCTVEWLLDRGFVNREG